MTARRICVSDILVKKRAVLDHKQLSQNVFFHTQNQNHKVMAHKFTKLNLFLKIPLIYIMYLLLQINSFSMPSLFCSWYFFITRISTSLLDHDKKNNLTCLDFRIFSCLYVFWLERHQAAYRKSNDWYTANNTLLPHLCQISTGHLDILSEPTCFLNF